jgi:hypothetical protein
MKQKFTSCGGIVPARMSPLEVWGTGGLLGSIGTMCSSQLAQNNVAGDSTLDINASTSNLP